MKGAHHTRVRAGSGLAVLSRTLVFRFELSELGLEGLLVALGLSMSASLVPVVFRGLLDIAARLNEQILELIAAHLELGTLDAHLLSDILGGRHLVLGLPDVRVKILDTPVFLLLPDEHAPSSSAGMPPMPTKRDGSFLGLPYFSRRNRASCMTWSWLNRLTVENVWIASIALDIEVKLWT